LYFTRNDIAAGYWTQDWKMATRSPMRIISAARDYLSLSLSLRFEGYLSFEISLRDEQTCSRLPDISPGLAIIRSSRVARATSKRLARSNGDTVEASTFSSSNGNNLNSRRRRRRRDDEELFPRVILESDAYYYQRASPAAVSLSLSV